MTRTEKTTADYEVCAAYENECRVDLDRVYSRHIDSKRLLDQAECRLRVVKATVRREAAWHRWSAIGGAAAWFWVVAWDQAYHQELRRLAEIQVAS